MTTETEVLTRRLEMNSERKLFAVIGKQGALHFWFCRTPEGFGSRDYYGGIEIHYRRPPSWADGKAPSNENCWLLNGPCWHDGSSLQAEEYWIPLYRSCDPDSLASLECIWLSLEGDYRNRFSEDE